jgi:hypothetical protein
MYEFKQSWIIDELEGVGNGLTNSRNGMMDELGELDRGWM